MTIQAEQGSTLLNPAMLDLLSRAIGGTQDQDITKGGTTTGTQTQTGTTTGTATNVNDSTTQSTADVEALKQVFAQQQAGITPQMLQAIFAEGQKAAPQLVATTANAVGARAGNNTPLATALTSLNAQLTSKAAELDMQQKNASSETAARIAQLTGGTKTTGTTQQTSNQANSSTGSSNTASSEKTNNQTDTQPNYGNVGNLLGLLLGGSALNTGLKDLGGIGGAVGQGTNAVGGLLQQLLSPLINGTGKPSQDFLGQAAGQLPGSALPSGPGTGVTAPADGLVPKDFLQPGATQPDSATSFDLSSLLSGLGLGAQSSESDFWSAIGLDPATLSLPSTEFPTGLPDLSNQDWFTGEGWNTLEWGG